MREGAPIKLAGALDLDRRLSWKSRDVAVDLASLAETLHESGQLDEAEMHIREALAIGEGLPDPEVVAGCTGSLAELALDRAQWPEAESLAREALKIAEEVGRKEMIATGYRCLAEALARQGRGAEGRCHAERAVAIFTELHSPELVQARAVLDGLH